MSPPIWRFLIYLETLSQITSETALQGHRDSVNAMKINADLTYLLSGGTLFYPFITPNYSNPCLDNSGLVIIWDLALRAPLQQIDASCAGSVTSVCWISLLKNITPGEDDPAPAFAVGFGTGTIAIYRQASENVSFQLLFLCTILSFIVLAAFWICKKRWSPWWARWRPCFRPILFEDC